ncbi:MAG: alpha/beta hydrolase [Alphaproteobacteria bacterium]
METAGMSTQPETPEIEQPPLEFVNCSDGRRIAYRHLPGKGPGVVMIHGTHGSMGGRKALDMERRCREAGIAYTRFDLFGHGKSSGVYKRASMTDWVRDTTELLEHLRDNKGLGPQLLLGSSSGGWVMLRAAQERPDLVAGMVGVAPAPDFTARRKKQFTMLDWAELTITGSCWKGAYGKQLIRDGDNHLMLGKKNTEITCPTHILQGKKDTVVPWQAQEKLKDSLPRADVSLTYVDDGDHGMGRDEDLDLIFDHITQVRAKVLKAEPPKPA